MYSVMIDGGGGRAAATEQQAQEIIARCISILVDYHNGERTQEATAMMVTKVQAVAIWVDELDFSIGETDLQVLHRWRLSYSRTTAMEQESGSVASSAMHSRACVMVIRTTPLHDASYPHAGTSLAQQSHPHPRELLKDEEADHPPHQDQNGPREVPRDLPQPLVRDQVSDAALERDREPRDHQAHDRQQHRHRLDEFHRVHWTEAPSWTSISGKPDWGGGVWRRWVWRNPRTGCLALHTLRGRWRCVTCTCRLGSDLVSRPGPGVPMPRIIDRIARRRAAVL